MSSPLVTIICVSHNQAPYIKEALESALAQSYHHLQIIAIDDGSADGSPEILTNLQRSEKLLEMILLPAPKGYCRAFNHAWGLARGEYIIDLAGDDVLLKDRVATGIDILQSNSAGVHFCDAYYINEESKILGTHYQRDEQGKLLETVPQGDVYEEILRGYFICAPTMMIRREVLECLDGYDEDLYYEDFDFWVRSSRDFKYCFTDHILVKKRVHPHSMAKKQYSPGSLMLPSTLKVCEKALELSRTPEEKKALSVRLKYELRQSVISNNYEVARGLHKIWGKIKGRSLSYRIWGWLISLGWDFSYLTLFMGKAR